MRKIVNLNNEWLFVKNTTDITVKDGTTVNLPHTWNAEDGMDGGNDYYRGTCVYKKHIKNTDYQKTFEAKCCRTMRSYLGCYRTYLYENS